MTDAKLGEVQGRVDPLLAWYHRERRILPWREEPTPYRVWVSEIMLQQTRVDTVIPYFERFMETFPTVAVLANASLDDVLALWSGLGYYSRARNLHQCARVVAEIHDGVFPSTVEDLLRLPGVGRYTAGAIASIAFQRPAPIVDGNVIRVLTRWTDLERDVTQRETLSTIWSWAEELVPVIRPGDLNQALMELGAMICTPRSPACSGCPVALHCRAFHNGTMEERPVKPRKGGPEKVAMTAFLVRNEQGEILLGKRVAKGLFGGLWTLPWIQTPSGSLANQVEWFRRDTGLSVRLSRETKGRVEHVLSHKRLMIEVVPLEALAEGGIPLPDAERECWDWVPAEQVAALGIGAVTHKMLSSLPGQQTLAFGEREGTGE